jgi:hypothetical protein
MTTFRILFGLLCLFHVGALFLNASHAQKTVPHRWKIYLPGWAIAAVASVVVVTMPNSPLSAFWQTWLKAVSAQAQSLLIGIYVLSLTACLALVFFRTPNPRGVPRSFIAFGLRLLFGRGTERETAQLIESGEYAIVGACGAAILLPTLVANGWFGAEQATRNLIGASIGASVCAMLVFRAIRRLAGDRH